MRIHIHLGAHKTATTFIQKTLQANKGRLKARGIEAPNLPTLRKEFTNRFNRIFRQGNLVTGLSEPALKRSLLSLLPDSKSARLAILSDENLAGPLAGNLTGEGHYPKSGSHASRIAGFLAQHEIHWFFCIRRHSEYLVSSYLQMIAQRERPEFPEFLSTSLRGSRGWGAIVEELTRLAGAERVTVWTYDRFKEAPQEILDLLAPESDIPLSRSQAELQVNQSITRKGEHILNVLRTHLSSDEMKHMAKLMKNFPFDPPDSKLEITDKAVLRVLDAHYEEDLVKIRATGCRFLE